MYLQHEQEDYKGKAFAQRHVDSKHKANSLKGLSPESTVCAFNSTLLWKSLNKCGLLQKNFYWETMCKKKNKFKM